MAGDSHRPLIMFVDDDDVSRMMATEFLIQAEFDVVDYSNGERAIAELQEHSPELIILDVEMPGLDGFAVCERVRSTTGFETTPILMLTGLDSSDSVKRAFQTGATDFSTKPINAALLSHRLHYMLRAWKSGQDLVKNQKSLDSAQRIAQVGNWELDVVTREMFASEHMHTMFGFAKGCDASINTFTNCIKPYDKTRVKSWFAKLLQEQTDDLSIDYCIVSLNGVEKGIRQHMEQVFNSNGDVVAVRGVLQDMTESLAMNNRVKQLANYDRVTGLPNRSLFHDRLVESLSRTDTENVGVAVLYIDIDEFKQVNDTLGHAIGDVMLNEVSRRISSAINGRGTLARMGADEFTVLVPLDCIDVEPEALAELITQKLGEPYSLNSGEIFSSASTGIAVCSQNELCADTLLKNADMAMSCAKKAGKNTYRIHENSMDEEAQTRFRIESQMRVGLERNEFQMFYQPQVDLNSGRLYCAEALIRWISPELGFVTPDQFIPIAEDNGFIVPLGEWVLRTACLQAVQWIDSNFPINQVAVNISVLQFICPDFTDMVQRVLKETGLDPKHLELEITESMLATDTSSAVTTLRKLKEIGVALSIDDFGTGYSSLSQLKQFPIDRLKLDRSFVQGTTTHESDAAITCAVIAMCASMGVKFLAEGVETTEQLEFLKTHECHEIQGYLISKPMPADELEANAGEILANLKHLFDDKGNLRLVA